MWLAKHSKITALALVGILLVAYLRWSPSPTDVVLHVAAASSLAEAITELNTAFTAETGTNTRLSLAASNVLARQLEAGAPADVFFSADVRKLANLPILSRRDLLSNTLVIIAPQATKLTFDDINSLTSAPFAKIAMGDPAAVPAGMYARQFLEVKGIYAAIQPKVIACESARAALAAVESGNVDVGIVYKTDALASERITVLYEIPATEGPAIVYPLVTLRTTKQPELAASYVEFLSSPRARAVFEQHGFRFTYQANASN